MANRLKISLPTRESIRAECIVRIGYDFFYQQTHDGHSFAIFIYHQQQQLRMKSIRDEINDYVEMARVLHRTRLFRIHLQLPSNAYAVYTYYNMVFYEMINVQKYPKSYQFNELR